MTDPRPASLGDPLPEGEEHPPPGTRAMAAVRWGLVALMAIAAVAAWVHVGTTSGVLATAQERWRCPMHPSVVMEHRGECPICGMDLVPVTSAAPGSPAPAAEPAGQQLYTCPMHPAFTSADPKARCPECGMKLVPREAAAVPPAGELAPPGLAEVELTADRIQLSGLRTAVAAREPLAPSIRTVGFVSASESGLVSVNARFSGWIESLGEVETGRLVEKGAVLAKLYSPDMQTAQQVFLNAIKWSERGRAGAGSGPAPGTGAGTIDVERDARQRLEALGVAPQDVEAIAQSGQVQRVINVRSPVRGYIARKNALRGLFVQPGTELFQLADLSTVWVLADVYEGEIRRVAVGQKATLTLAAWPGEEFLGRVSFIYPALNPGSRTLQARLEFSNPHLKLRPGMYGDVTLALAAAEAVVIPRDALVDTGEAQYVFVSRGHGRFAPRRVRAGWSATGKVAILEGLSEGERVVTTANFLVDSESRLRAAIESQGAPAPGR
ncbi:MAG TPA: efflux RND transporter periplasmic adaptor subunit [Anaeromyxobacter sp.]|nr:efflux RND transporter periplasmic adaptor subunit [Anaeromyxobacter sp.]